MSKLPPALISAPTGLSLDRHTTRKARQLQVCRCRAMPLDEACAISALPSHPACNMYTSMCEANSLIRMLLDCRWVLHIVDTNPNSLSARGWLEDTSKVQKYTMSDEEYKARENTYWKYKEEKLKVKAGTLPSCRWLTLQALVFSTSTPGQVICRGRFDCHSPPCL